MDLSDPEVPPSQANRLLQRATDHPARSHPLGGSLIPFTERVWKLQTYWSMDEIRFRFADRFQLGRGRMIT